MTIKITIKTRIRNIKEFGTECKKCHKIIWGGSENAMLYNLRIHEMSHLKSKQNKEVKKCNR